MKKYLLIVFSLFCFAGFTQKPSSVPSQQNLSTSISIPIHQRTLNIEIVQALFGLKDSAGANPQVLDGSNNYLLNTMGQKWAKFIYTFQPLQLTN